MAAVESINVPATGPKPDFRQAELLGPSVYSHAVRDIEIKETNLSLLVLTGEFVYKIKKRLSFEFLDTMTLATRHHLCEEELRLNQRFAPDLYLEVVALTRDEDGLHMGGIGRVIDYAVKMRQFDASQELLALLRRGEVSATDIRALAERLAGLHQHSGTSTEDATFDYVAQLRNSVLGNVAALLAHLHSLQEFPAMCQLIDWTHDSLHDLHSRFHKRQARGFIRECHGDLHAHNIVSWHGRLTPFDCLEFDPKLRWIDTMNDVAFLVMDLVGQERNDLAFEFLSRYLERSGDYSGVRLLPFYAVYRALVRAMVDALGAEQRPAQRMELQSHLHARISTALQFMQPKRPSLFIMHGPSGSGKSWLSERLVPLLAAVRLRSEVERKGATYARLLKGAENCLQAGVSVIVDAAFLTVEDRQQFRALATRSSASFVILSCIADKSVMAERIAQRVAAHADPSDATVAELHQQQKFVPLRADEVADVIRVDTMQLHPQRAALATLQARQVNLAEPPVAWPSRRERLFALRPSLQA
jgi:hypothetical protein